MGVTWPNEYENNVKNNCYTNYLSQWCLSFTLESLKLVEEAYPNEYTSVVGKTGIEKSELRAWSKIVDQMYFPFSEEHQVFLQQDGFLDKELVPADELSKKDRPINQKWSWDRILRSPYIKQADVLQGFYFFENHFDDKMIEKHFDFYEPLTVHESSLSPCVHSILASKIDRNKKAYEMYLRTSRLDLDDYNHEVHEGLHITSMAGTWLSIVQGFGGMRNFDNQLTFDPKIPKNWKSYSFKIKYREHTIKVFKNHESCKFYNESDTPVNIIVSGKEITIFNQDLVVV